MTQSTYHIMNNKTKAPRNPGIRLSLLPIGITAMFLQCITIHAADLDVPKAMFVSDDASATATEHHADDTKKCCVGGQKYDYSYSYSTYSWSGDIDKTVDPADYEYSDSIPLDTSAAS